MKKLLSYLDRNKLFISALFLIHLFYFSIAVIYQDIYTLDSDEYLQTAFNFTKYKECYNYFWEQAHRPEYFTLRPPLYGVFILCVKQIYDSDLFVIFVQNIMNIITCVFFAELFRKKGIGKEMKVVSILALVFFPTQMIMANSIMADQLLQCFLLLAFAYLMRYTEKRNLNDILFYNLMLVLAVYTKPVLMYFWIPNTILCLYLYFQNRQKQIILSSIIFPVFIFVWCARNELRTGLFHFSSIKTQNILDLNAGAVITLKEGEERAIEVKDSILAKAELIRNYKERVEFIHSESMKIITADLRTYLYAHTKGMVNFMLAAGRTDLVDFFPDKPKKEISIIREFEKDGLAGIWNYLAQVNLFLVAFMACIAMWNVLMLAGFLSFSFNPNFDPVVRVFVFVLVGYICFVCGPGGYARLKMCIMPMMLVNLPFLFQLIRTRFKRKVPQS